MGLFDSVVDFFTGTRNTTQDQTSSVASNQNVEKTQIGGETQASTSAQGTTGASTQAITRNLLDPAIQQQLADLITSISGQTGGQQGQQELANLLTQRATTAPQDIAATIAPIIAEARTAGTRQLGQQGQALSREAGSSMNSMVQQLQAEGSNDLETKLASLAAQLGLQGRQMASQEGQAALSASGGLAETGARQVATLADVLKGASETSAVTGTTEQQQTTNSLTQLNKVLEELAKGQTVQTSAGTTGQSQTGTILDFLNTRAFFKQ